MKKVKVREGEIVEGHYCIGFEMEDGSMQEQHITEVEWEEAREGLMAEAKETGEKLYLFPVYWTGKDTEIEDWKIDGLTTTPHFDPVEWSE